jgi:hypothetical protein
VSIWGSFGSKFEYLVHREGCMWSMQCNVELGYQLSICSRTKENHGKPWSSWSAAGPSGGKLATSRQSSIEFANPSVSPYLCSCETALLTKKFTCQDYKRLHVRVTYRVVYTVTGNELCVHKDWLQILVVWVSVAGGRWVRLANIAKLENKAARLRSGCNQFRVAFNREAVKDQEGVTAFY